MLASASEIAEMSLTHELSWHIWWLEGINSGQLIFFPFWWHFLLPRYTLQLTAATVPQPLCAPVLHLTLQYILSQFIPILQVEQARWEEKVLINLAKTPLPLWVSFLEWPGNVRFKGSNYWTGERTLMHFNFVCCCTHFDFECLNKKPHRPLNLPSRQGLCQEPKCEILFYFKPLLWLFPLQSALFPTCVWAHL